jgi:DNA-binding response OmpR family regulator
MMHGAASVLLVEDDAATARMMRLILEPEGYELRIASDRDDALAAVSARLPNAVIMDYYTSGTAPDSFITEIRQRGFTGPIVLCTALSDPPALAVDDVLLKPFDPDELPRRLAILLSGSERGDATPLLA